METTIAEQPTCLGLLADPPELIAQHRLTLTLVCAPGRNALSRTDRRSGINRFITPLTIIVAIYATAASAQTAQYTVTDLGNIGGNGVYPNAINSYGEVTGTANGAVGGTGYAFLWTAPGPMISLGALGSPATQSSGNSINDSGWVVGQSNSEAFLYTPQTALQPLGFLPGGTYSQLQSINNSDVAVGAANPAGTTTTHAMIWDPTNGMRDLNNMIVNAPTTWTPNAALAISQNGLIAGIGASSFGVWPETNQHAFVLSGGSMTVIPELGIDTQPASINSSGEVVGTYDDANDQQHGFVYTPANGIRDIGNLGGSIVDPTFVSDQGLVLGGSELADGSSAAFLYTDAGGMVNLNTLAPINGWTLYYAAAMNQNGQIICAGTNGHGSDAFLLTPTPEPSTYCLLIAAFCFLLISQLCRRRLARL